ncbi:hypothetical protein, partial [Klebsiella pneumoniae]|uniref:hypothetical protein n=1 Tax=Klebsiella pneumoniae TaxID=573 RepID=UPI0039C0CFF8
TVVVPGSGVTLAAGTQFPAGITLNFDVQTNALSLPAGTRLPVAAKLTQTLELRAGTVLAADIHDASGTLLFAAGTLLSQNQTL